MTRVALIAIAVAGAFAAGFYGGSLKGAAEVADLQRAQAEATAALQQRIVRLGNDLSEKAAALDAEKAARAAIIKEVEDEAASDGADLRRPSAASLRRLERRWGG